MRTPQLSGLPEATAARARRRAVKQHFRSARKLGDRGRVLGLLSCLGGVFTTPRVARTGMRLGRGGRRSDPLIPCSIP